ncbi:VlhA.4.07.6 variable lipoprotein family protein [Mycoplasmoides gallisepticum str. R(low)]|uniref:VlhA.4.07.6 variable lipoprotein family protein n=1 Tax=Mycoplasmoides gallisepticum (strain R(low / passage 15 / clone 2)) TaxID=710127 RepID=D3DEI4_MYCGA|nr:FIVAR domain-containing protein [Mycoplasmoides gallisepticum]ADB96865.1 VlhA.4.07.6 variable lipoprotein family protein [Mycoplasmoides gallisepticum str. R(low)]ADC30395.1 VlhA.4.07.6 variable lipoprotein family protein [Mycoplasmoides gallisepticum str. R(high)]
MKRKNILKFVSLLGIGSFVMLAAASCTSATTPTPNPTPKPDPMPNPGGGMNGGNTNRGNGGGMMGDNPNPGNTTPEQQLAAARKTLTDLLGTENTNVAFYADYAKIQSTLNAAYMTAKTASENTSASLENLRSASTTLQAAIDKAASDKRAFDSANQSLVTAYNNLKTTLQFKTTSLEELSENKYSGIKNHLSKLFDTGSAITAKTLDPTSGERPTLEKVNEANNSIKMAISPESLKKWKDNADKFNEFEKNPLSKEKLSTGTDSAHNQEQPANYSFVGYSVDVTGTTTAPASEKALLNWNYAQRTIFTSGDQPTKIDTPAASDEAPAQPLSNVSWIYSLAGNGAKYTLDFTYYGPSTGYLYFPYKLVKNSDSVGLQYKLNNSPTETAIAFGNMQNANGPTATVDSINIAKVTLSNLNFGANKIEFSVPSEKVAPMIGNMYLTSSADEANKQKIENSIFGNSVTTENNRTIISVDALSGYSLASDWSTFIGRYADQQLTLDGKMMRDQKYYLIGYVGGNTGARNVTGITEKTNEQRSPVVSTPKTRTYTFYVNAPKAGAYYIKGVFASKVRRDLKFSTGDMSSNNVTIQQLSTNNLTTLRTFDTSATTGATRVTTVSDRKTLTLVEGLNKIVVSGATADNGNAPNFGYLEFILNETQPETTNVSNPS